MAHKKIELTFGKPRIHNLLLLDHWECVNVMKAMHKTQVLALRAEANRRGYLLRSEFNVLLGIFSRYKAEILEQKVGYFGDADTPEFKIWMKQWTEAFGEAVAIDVEVQQIMDEAAKSAASQQRGNVVFVDRNGPEGEKKVVMQ